MTVPAEAISAFPMFSGLPAEGLRHLARDARRQTYRGGERLFLEDQPARGCWLIETGQVALDFRVPGRGREVVATVPAGDVVGLSWLVPQGQWQFGAVALEPTTAIILDTDQVSTLAESDAEFGRTLATRMFRESLHRLTSTRARLLDVYRSPREQ